MTYIWKKGLVEHRVYEFHDPRSKFICSLWFDKFTPLKIKLWWEDRKRQEHFCKKYNCSKDQIIHKRIIRARKKQYKKNLKQYKVINSIK